MAQEEKKSGLTAIEYGLLSAVIAVVIITATTVCGEIVGQKIADDAQAAKWVEQELRDLKAENAKMRADVARCADDASDVTP